MTEAREGTLRTGQPQAQDEAGRRGQTRHKEFTTCVDNRTKGGRREEGEGRKSNLRWAFAEEIRV